MVTGKTNEYICGISKFLTTYNLKIVLHEKIPATSVSPNGLGLYQLYQGPNFRETVYCQRYRECECDGDIGPGPGQAQQ